MNATENKAVFLSYASQDAEAARRIREALRDAGVEVWFSRFARSFGFGVLSLEFRNPQSETRNPQWAPGRKRFSCPTPRKMRTPRARSATHCGPPGSRSGSTKANPFHSRATIILIGFHEQTPRVMKFRKKPVVIDAVQFNGLNFEELSAFCGRIMQRADVKGVDHAVLEIHTREGTMRARVGDWIIRGVQGEFYPCKPEIFAATYEAVVR